MIRKLIFSALLITSCTTHVFYKMIIIPYTYEDQSSSKTFRLTYKNTTQHQICVSTENWPNAAGKINGASSNVWVEIEGSHTPYKIADFNTGYCPGCVSKVNPGETITGTIPYSEFSIPQSLSGNNKILRFRPQGYICKI